MLGVRWKGRRFLPPFHRYRDLCGKFPAVVQAMADASCGETFESKLCKKRLQAFAFAQGFAVVVGKSRHRNALPKVLSPLAQQALPT